MSPERLPRKLAAILYTDVAEYGRLTGIDEEGTHRRLGEYLDAITGLIGKHCGEVDHYAGDAVLAHFVTVTDALACALELLDDIDERNADVPDDRKLEFRVGVNVGEVIVDRGEIWGDGVIVAARLESLAEAGGLCISEAVRSALGNKLPIDYEFIGERQVKNMPAPVRAYRVVRRRAPSGKTSAIAPPAPGAGISWKLREGFTAFSSDSFRASRAALPTLHGRDRELAVMERHLSDVTAGSKMAYVHGSLGVGKTGLAVKWWHEFSLTHRRSIPYVLLFDCASTEGAGNLALDIANMLFDVTRDTLERNRGILVEQIVEVAKVHELVLILDNLERLQAPASAGEFRDYIRGDVGRLLLLLMHEQCRSRIVVCSQRYAPQLDWDISGRILPIHARPLSEAQGVEVIRNLVASQGGAIGDADALVLSRREKGIPLNLMSAALAYVKHGETATLSSAIWDSDPFEENMIRYRDRLSGVGLTIVRMISLSEEGLTHATLRWLLHEEGDSLGVTGSPQRAIEAALLENELVISVTSAPPRDAHLDHYQISHVRFRNFFRADWEGSHEEGQAARTIHRLLARVAWYRAERWRDAGKASSGEFDELPRIAYPPDPHPYEGSIRALRRYFQCLHHSLASVDPGIVAYRPRLTNQKIRREDAPEALSNDASAELIVRFAYDVVYLQMIERGGQWYLSRGLGADDIRVDLLARFFRLGSSTFSLAEGLLPLERNSSEGTPRVPLLPRFLTPNQQGSLLFSMGIAAHGLGERQLAQFALDAAFTQRRHFEDFRRAAKILTTIADLQMQSGSISQWLDKCSYYLWEFARWEPDSAVEELGELRDEDARDRARIVAELLGRFAHARMLMEGADAALPYFATAETVRRLLSGDRGFLDGNIGRRYRQALVRTGSYQGAEVRNRHASEHHRGKKHELALLAIDRASIYRARDRLGHAEMALREAQVLTRPSGTSRNVLFEYRLEEARLLIATGRTDQAGAITEEVRWRAKSRSLALIECDASLLLADAHRDSDRQRDYLAAAEDVIDGASYGYRRPDLAVLRDGGSAVAELKV